MTTINLTTETETIIETIQNIDKVEDEQKINKHHLPLHCTYSYTNVHLSKNSPYYQVF